MADRDFRVKNGLIVSNYSFSANASGLYFSNNFFANSSSINATATTANNSTFAYGKTESALNVASALDANNSLFLGGVAAASYQLNSTLSANVARLTANNTTNAFGKTEGNLNVNSALIANNSTYAYGKTEGNLNANSALTANNSSYLGTVIASSYLRKDSTATITIGYNITPYSLTSASFTVNPTLGNYQFINSLTSSITITAPSSDCAVDIMITNGSGAGLAFFGFTVQTNGTGDAYATTSGNKYLISIRRINSISTYIIKALQ